MRRSLSLIQDLRMLKSFVNSSNLLPRSTSLVATEETFTACWLPETEALLKEYETTGNPDTATHLLSSLESVCHQIGRENVESINFTHSRRKAWNILHHLGAASLLQHCPPQVTTNAVASKLQNSKGVTSKQFKGSRCVRNFLLSWPHYPLPLTWYSRTPFMK